MIPWFEPPSLSLPFGIPLHAFGALAALGIYVASRLSVRAARVYGLGDPHLLARVAPWALVGGIIGAHLLHVLGYHPEMISQQGGWVLFQPWNGISSMGGVLGGIAGVVLFFRRERLPLQPHVDALVLGLAPGWAIARVGCFTAHDHPGVLTDFPLAVQFPGGARHDLGLYDALLLALLTAVLYWIARKRPAHGVLTGVLAVGYAVPRFFLDFLRATDLPVVDGRLLGLTPGQYICLGLIAVGARLLWPSVRAHLPRFSPHSRKRRLAVVGSILLGTVGCDQVTKHAAEVSLSDGITRSFGGDVLRVGLTHNHGAFLSAGSTFTEETRTLLFIVVVGLLLLGALVAALAWRKLPPGTVAAFALVLGGGIGNWLDRVLREGAVTDFLNLGIGPLRTGVFNVADVAIVLGAVLMVLPTRNREPLPVHRK